MPGLFFYIVWIGDLRVYSMAKIKNINSLFHIEGKSDNILRYEKIAAGHTNV